MKQLLGALLILSLISACSSPDVMVDRYGETAIVAGPLTPALGDLAPVTIYNALRERPDLFPGLDGDGAFKVLRVSHASGMTALKLGQRWRGLPVFGHGVVAHADGTRLVYVVDHVARLPRLDTAPALTPDEAGRMLRLLPGLASGTILRSELGVSVRDGAARLVHRIVARGGTRGAGGKFEVDARTGAVARIEPEVAALKATVTLKDGTQAEIDIAKLGDEYTGALCDGPYCIFDTTRAPGNAFGVTNISGQYEVTPGQMGGRPAESKIFAADAADGWTGNTPDGMQAPRVEGVSMAHTIAGVYDWYGDTFGWKGIAGTESGFDVITSAAGTDPLSLNAFWDITTNSAIILFLVLPAGGGSRSFSMSPDVLGHEFTHGVLAAPLAQGGLCELEYANDITYQSASVHEGFADTMGNLHSDPLDQVWKMGENDIIDDAGNVHWLRNDSNPYDADAMTWGDMVYNSKASCETRFCGQFPPPKGHEKDCPTKFDSYDSSYVCATIIPYPAWKMTRALGADKVGKIYFHVIDKYLGQKAKLAEVSQFVFDSCADLYPNDTATCCVVYQALIESKFTINLRGLACAEPDGGTAADAGLDAAAPDAGAADAGFDSGAPDTGADDTGTPDAGIDASPGDTGAADGGGAESVGCGQYTSTAGYQGRPCTTKGEVCDKLNPVCSGLMSQTCVCTAGLWDCPKVTCPADDAGIPPDTGTAVDDAGGPGPDAGATKPDAGLPAEAGGGCSCSVVTI